MVWRLLVLMHTFTIISKASTKHSVNIQHKITYNRCTPIKTNGFTISERRLSWNQNKEKCWYFVHLDLDYNILLESLHYAKSSLKFLSFSVPCAPCLAVPVEHLCHSSPYEPEQSVLLRSPSIDNGAHGTENLLLKTHASKEFA